MSSPSTTTRRGLTVLAAGLLGAGALAAVPATASAAPGRHAYPGSVPGFVSDRNDAGQADADTTVEGELFLPLRDPAGAQALATAVSTPGNPQYGKYLPPQAWIGRFAPTPATLKAAEKYLTDNGATIWATPASRQYVVFRAPVAAVDAAFGTQLHTYRVNGNSVIAPSTPASLPASIADNVSGVSIGTSRQALTRPSDVAQGSGPVTSPDASAQGRAGSSSTSACSNYWGEHSNTLPEAYGRTEFPTFICGYTPAQLRSAGNVGRQTGAGQTIAIIDAYASPTIVQDTNDYMTAVGQPLLTNFQQIAPAPKDFVDTALCQEPSGWQGEEHIDVQSAHSIAPGAKILYVGGFNCGAGLDIAMSQILDNGLSNIVSNSYGNQGEDVPEDMVAGQENLHLQAAAEGIGLYFSSGDSGDESVNLGHTEPDYPASSPFVTAVGGTSEAINADGSYGFETGWGDILDKVVNGAYTAPLPGASYGGGAGGGVSALFPEPAYQRGVVPNSIATANGGTGSRVVPDIADLADPYTGFRVGRRPIIDDSTLATGPFQYETWGGTSLACPIAAAKMALVQAATKSVIGFANPALYQAARQQPSAFHDVFSPSSPVALYYKSAKSGNVYLNTLNQGLSLDTRPGYDTMTGVGSLVEPALAEYIGQAVRNRG
jgi:subtilase family serine protease